MTFLAHGPGPSSSEVFFFLAFFAAWALSGLFIWIDLAFFLLLRASAAFRAANAVWWVCYTLPWLYLMFRPPGGFFPTNFQLPADLRLVIGVAIPLATFCHFAFLCWVRRRVGTE